MEDRDRYLRLLDNAMARGLLDGEEYMDRAAAIDGATSIEDLNRIVQEMPLLPMGGTRLPSASTATPGVPSAERARDVQNVNDIRVDPKIDTSGSQVEGVDGEADGANVDADVRELGTSLPDPLPEIDAEAKLDAVDIALLHRQSRARPTTATSNRRWTALIVIAVMFILLVVVGVLLAAHTKSVNNDGLVALGAHAHLELLDLVA